MQITKEITIQETTTKEQIDFADNIKEWLIHKGYTRLENTFTKQFASYRKGLITISPSFGGVSGISINICESLLIDDEGRFTTLYNETNIDKLIKRLKEETAQANEDIKELYDLAFGGEK